MFKFLTFNAAADGSSGSLRNGRLLSVFKFAQCRIRTSPMLNIVGTPVD